LIFPLNFFPAPHETRFFISTTHKGIFLLSFTTIMRRCYFPNQYLIAKAQLKAFPFYATHFDIGPHQSNLGSKLLKFFFVPFRVDGNEQKHFFPFN
jgi:hypothetical protein